MGVISVGQASLGLDGRTRSIVEQFNRFPPSGDFESIATVNLSSSVGNITLSSIPSSYSHLQLRISIRSTANSSVNMGYWINDNATYSNYRWHVLAGTGSTVYGGSYGDPSNNLLVQPVNGANSTTGVFSAMIMDILDYSNTSKNTTVRTFAGWDNNGSGTVTVNSSLWANTSAVTSLTLRSWGDQWVAGSTVALYGIRG